MDHFGEHYLIAPAGGADPDEVGSLQGELCGIIDRINLKNLVRGFAIENDWPHVHRLEELQDSSTSHD